MQIRFKYKYCNSFGGMYNYRDNIKTKFKILFTINKTTKDSKLRMSTYKDLIELPKKSLKKSLLIKIKFY